MPGKIGQVLCTGNITDSSTYDFLRQIAPELHIVKGDSDDNQSLATTKIVRHGTIKIGLTNGFTLVPHAEPDALLIAARQLDVDVFVSGSSHQFEAYEYEGKFFINPGSATGSLSPQWSDAEIAPIPSFVLMDVQEKVLILYVYQLVQGDVKVERFKFDTGS